jgi:transcriptional regulator with XRE-family HTH domain
VQKSIYTVQQRRFLELLRAVRKEAGLTQDQLAERLGTLQSRITDYERGIRRLDLMELRQVCVAVGVPLLEFVRRFEETNNFQDKDDSSQKSNAADPSTD